MIIKENFVLLKGVPNILNLSPAEIKRHSIQNGVRNLSFLIQPLLSRVKHFTRDKVAESILKAEGQKYIAVVNLEKYNLHVSYNQPTEQMVVNLSPFGVDDVSRLDPMNCYAYMVYAISFKNLITKKVVVNESYASTIINYYLSIFIRLFGKEYGLLGIYSSEIIKLKYLISCYVLSSYFGITGNELYRRSSIIAPINYREILDQLQKYNFSNIEDFIKSLSDFKVLTGINKYSFTSRILRILSVNFLPAVEDLSRFISIITTSSITGSSLIHTFLSSAYNQDEYRKLLEISKLLFR